ncbi:reverse transcriptase family protein [Rhodococcus sp. (in: high G+C Gram-positive bacteria)]|uniref:reverse transcriptase family protein n=1 Tax=Rhodococcus sp. TaxID=1831 RepID=UPI001A1D2844|nr:reverse transcriptase family protein [Rhodococcus sp. (in: high G+C Gram-positive bacteria)]MBJ7480392.1 RNA-directed DNA polymerase [Rhodococcus sp. (in: high G+C Gram-positive bacteria)]
MRDFELDPELARRLAVAAADAPWTLGGLEEAFGTVHGVSATSLAVRVLDLMPAPPFEPQTLYRLLRELPRLRPVPVSMDTNESSVWRFDVPRYNTSADLARSLDLTISELEWFSDRGEWLRTKPLQLHHYRPMQISKKAGVRLLEIPKPRLREIQRKILRRILDQVPAHDAAHGFVRGRSPLTFAAPHAQSEIVIGVDLMQFFPSITGNRVHAVFAALGYPPAVAGVLTGLCTVATPADTLRGLPYAQASQLRTAHLPQGAPTSPALANLVARTFDIRSSALAQANWLAYTRYADDLAFSGIEIADVGTLLWTINQIAQDEGFDVHPRKIKVMRPHRRQHLTGLVINDQPSYPRDDYDRLRALLHNAANTSAQEQNRAGIEHFRAHIYGRIAHIGETSTTRRRTLLRLAERVDWDD